jgi:hypothetical protein
VLSRSILVVVAILQILQAYPVAGTQVVVGTFLIVPAVLVCVVDVRAFAAERLSNASLAAAVVAAAAVAVAAPALVSTLEWKMWRQLYLVYRTLPELRLSGSSLIRLPAADVARLHLLAGTTAANCSTLLTFPGVYSLNAWSGVPPPTQKNATTWMTLLSDPQQAEIWRAMDAARAPCVIFNPGLAASWLDTQPIESLTAYREMTSRFAALTEVDGYSLMLPKGRRSDAAGPSATPLLLIAGRQTFTNERSPLPIASIALRRDVPSTLRAWIRTKRRGVVIGCESDSSDRGPNRWLPLIYVGRAGHVYGQYSTASGAVQASPAPVNDGNWHQIALVRTERGQTLYVDGVHAASSDLSVDDRSLATCLVGAGTSMGWPDVPDGALRFVGDVDELALFPVALTDAEIRADWIREPRR